MRTYKYGTLVKAEEIIMPDIEEKPVGTIFFLHAAGINRTNITNNVANL